MANRDHNPRSFRAPIVAATVAGLIVLVYSVVMTGQAGGLYVL